MDLLSRIVSQENEVRVIDLPEHFREEIAYCQQLDGETKVVVDHGSTELESAVVTALAWM